MVETQAISIRLDSETLKRVEEKRGNQIKSEFYRQIILDYLDSPANTVADKVITGEQERELTRLKAELEQEKIVSIMHADRIRDLQKDLGWTQLAYQTLQADSQKISDKLLLLLPAPQERKEKQWFEFWK
jgi:hypothetical protein